MRKIIAAVLTLAAALAVGAGSALAETTLEKIARTDTLTIGTRTGSPPFAYVNSKNEWVGFSIDLVEQLVLPEVSKKLGKPIKLEKKESTPPTRMFGRARPSNSSSVAGNMRNRTIEACATVNEKVAPNE